MLNNLLLWALTLMISSCTVINEYPTQGFNTKYCGDAVLVSSMNLKTNIHVPMRTIIKRYGGYLSGVDMQKIYYNYTKKHIKVYLPIETKEYKKGDMLLINNLPILHWITIIKIENNKILIHDPSIFGGIYYKPLYWFNNHNILLILR